MEDWDNDDKNLLAWKLLQEILISKKRLQVILKFQSKYYDNGVLMVAMVKAGCWWL
jgi:hypothetical protein